MSCGPCNCDDCQDERVEDEEYERPAPIQNYFWSDVEPANEVQAKAWMGYINEVYTQYPNIGIPMMALVSMVGQKIPGLRPENYNKVTAQVQRLIRESPDFEIRKGKSGGVFRKDPQAILDTVLEQRIQKAIATAKEMAGIRDNPISYAKLTEMAGVPDLITGQVKDNYTCKGCGNTKLHDTNDKSCWSCGRKVGT